MREVCNTEWDDIQDRLKEKDAEIAKLKGLLAEAAAALGNWCEHLVFGQPAIKQQLWLDSQLVTKLRNAAQ
jgi:hypothetical protein